MLVLGLLSLIIGSTSARLTADSVAASRPRLDSVQTVAGDAPTADTALARLVVAPPDTNRRRPRVVEVSEWYSRRLTIHRYVAYATIPVFAVQYAAGEQLYNKSSGAPTWAKTFHRVGATALAGMFTVNTVTGVWNLWDSRSVKQGRTLRTVHALAMLTADGAFTYAGAKLSNEAETSADKRSLHRTIALSAMGLTIASGLAMKLWNH
ncbi:MAG: putative rane protein [Gemmatimonadetes bacterium]|nr:putative rane protein [Gemmatimonadota bacterium]